MRIDHPRADQTADVRQLWKLVFSESDRFLDHFFSLAYAPERCLCAWEGKSLAGMLHWLPCRRGEDPMVYLYAVATHPAYRGKGVCRALMSAAHETLTSQGITGCLLYPQEEGLREMYRKMGYENCGGIHLLQSTAADTPIPLRQIDAAEYARLRRSLLPYNGVVQEGPTLAVLAKECRLYAGNNLLFCVARLPEGLFIPEFLGDQTAVPGVLTALGASEGVLRMPGKSFPFAMFRPLAPGIQPPAYFGLPLD